jgi:hypothetical protein
MFCRWIAAIGFEDHIHWREPLSVRIMDLGAELDMSAVPGTLRV